MYLGRFLEQLFMVNVGLKCRVQSLRSTPPLFPGILQVCKNLQSFRCIELFRERLSENCAHDNPDNMGYDQYAVPDT